MSSESQLESITLLKGFFVLLLLIDREFG